MRNGVCLGYIIGMAEIIYCPFEMLCRWPTWGTWPKWYTCRTWSWHL